MDSFTRELGQWSLIEVVAVVLAVAYVVLAARQIIWCWPCAIASTALFFWVFLERALFQQAVLQFFYVGMGIYGWRKWHGGGKQGTQLRISTWGARRHAVAIALVLTLTATTGWLEARYASTSMPYLDAFTAWGSVVATWMMARKVLENWLYWFIVDSLMVVLTLRAGLPATAVLFVIYVGMAIVGFLSWRGSQLRQRVAAPG